MSLQPHAFVHELLRARIRQRRATTGRLEQYRRVRLARLLRDARWNVPFQRNRLQGIDLDQVDLERIPPTSKEEMMEHFDDTIAAGAVSLEEVQKLDEDHQDLELAVLRDRYVATKTSGSSGVPSWIIHGTDDWARTRAATFARITRPWLTFRRFAMSRFRPLRTATIAAAHAHSLTWQAHRAVEQSLANFGDYRFYSVLDSVADTIAGLNDLQPEYVHSYPTFMETLARHKLRGADVNFEPALISVGSEKMTPITNNLIRKAFPNTFLVDHYGLTECLQLSTSCTHGTLHLNSDVAVFEPVDAAGQPVPAGEFSDHVLITNLINRVQPLIRYRVNDSVCLLPDKCPCGSPFPTIQVHSRKGDQIYLRDDENAWQILSPPIVVDIMVHMHGIAQYQVIHRTQNELLVSIVVEEGAGPADVAAALRRQFMQTLERLKCAQRVTLTVKAVDEIPRTAVGGKLLQMRSLVEPPAETEHRSAA